MEKSRVDVLGELEILRKLGIQPMDKVRVVPRQPPRPQMPYIVGHILFMMECSYSLQKEMDI